MVPLELVIQPRALGSAPSFARGYLFGNDVEMRLNLGFKYGIDFILERQTANLHI